MQVLPVTAEEKRIAEEKRKTLEEELRKAEEAWRGFYKPESEPWWQEGVTPLHFVCMLIVSISFGTAVFYFFRGSVVAAYAGWITMVLIMSSFLHFFFKSESAYAKRKRKTLIKAEEDFAEQHKRFSEILGFPEEN